MIINCIYETNTDIGFFESNAKLNTETGDVFNVEQSERSDDDEVEEIYSTKIIFKFKGVEYIVPVEDDESTDEYTVKNSDEFKEFLIIQKHDSIASKLSEKTDKKPSKKI